LQAIKVRYKRNISLIVIVVEAGEQTELPGALDQVDIPAVDLGAL
jgi:hypothetical protein